MGLPQELLPAVRGTSQPPAMGDGRIFRGISDLKTWRKLGEKVGSSATKGGEHPKKLAINQPKDDDVGVFMLLEWLVVMIAIHYNNATC